MQTFTVPEGVNSLSVVATGGSGSTATGTEAGVGGLGGSVTDVITVIPGDIINIFVGGAGVSDGGGFNGGGNGGSNVAGGGGGASDIRLNGTDLTNRVIVAGGGGGGGKSGCLDNLVSVPNPIGGNGGAGIGEAGQNGATSPGGGGGFGGTLNVGGLQGVGCGGFLGSVGDVPNGGNGQSCCCSSSIPGGGGGGGGGYLNGGGGGGGSAGTVGCAFNHKGAGGGGAGGSSLVSVNGVVIPAVIAGNGSISITYCYRVSVSISPSTTVCPGTMVTLNASSFSGGTITWDNNIENNVPFQINQTTTYNVLSSSLNDCSINPLTVIVEDLSPEIPILSNINSECSVTPEIPTTTDACSGTITGTTTTVFPITALGTTVVTWTFIDGSGNSVTVDQSITITDDVTPPETTILQDINEVCSATPETPTTIDACSGTITGTTTTVFPITTQGTTVVTWTFTDDAGNSTTVDQNIILTDAISPVINCANNFVVDLLQGESSYIVSGTELDPVSVTDNCVGTVVLNDINMSSTLSGESLPIGETIVTWTATDNASNIGTCSTTITVNAYNSIKNIKTQISIYPNPTNGVFTINFPKNIKIQDVTISDIAGNIIIKSIKNSFDLTSYSSGIYFVKITTDKGILLKRIVKE